MATTRTWFGGTGQFNNANDWNPTGVPVSDDTAVIEAGTVRLSNTGLSGVTFELVGTSADTQPVIALRNAALNDQIFMFPASGGGDVYGEIDASGVVTSAGNINVPGGRMAPSGFLTIDIKPNASFVNTGNINDAAQLNVSGGTFVNNGTVATLGAQPVFNTDIIGTGVFEAFVNASLGGGSFHFEQSVSAGITVDLLPSQASFLQQVIIDKPLQFLAAIKDFDSAHGPSHVVSNDIDLPNTPEAKITSDTFADNQLKLFDGHKLVADLNIIGDFTVDNFALSADAKGGTLITFAPTPAVATSDSPPIVPSMAHS